jgi:hypothetical protein
MSQRSWTIDVPDGTLARYISLDDAACVAAEGVGE